MGRYSTDPRSPQGEPLVNTAEPLRLHALGGLALNGAEPPQRLRLVLLAAIAAAADKGISRDRLVAIFWPDSDEQRARGALKQAVYMVRRELKQPDLFLGVDDLRLNPQAIWSDVGDFEAALRKGDLARAVERYGGPFLAGIHVGNGEFERWRQSEEQRFAGRYREALERLAKTAEQGHDVAAAVAWWRKLAAADPLCSAVALALMQALVEAGDRAGAIQHARVHTTMVRDALDAEPDGAVAELASKLRRDTKPSAVAPPVTTAPPTVEAAPAEAPVVEVPAPSAAGGRRIPWSKLAIAAGLLVAATPATRSFLPPMPGSVEIRIERGLSRPIDSLAEAAAANSVALRVPGSRLVTGWGRPARFRLSISTQRDGDSLTIWGALRDRTGSPAFRIEPGAGLYSAPRELIQAFGERAAIALAAATNPIMRRWAYQAALPNNWAGYQGLVAAIAGWRIGDQPTTTDRLAQVITTDPTSGAAIAFKALVFGKHQLAREADSALTVLGQPTVRTGPWERGIGPWIRAWGRNDLMAAHLTGHQLLDSVPGSDWAILPAYAALGLGYAREAVELAEEAAPDFSSAAGSGVQSSASPGWLSFWRDRVRIQSWYHLGRFDSILVAIKTFDLTNPDMGGAQLRIKALAGLGRVAEVEALCAEALTRLVEMQPCSQAIIELRGRGFRDAARRVGDRLIAAFGTGNEFSERALLALQAEFAGDAGDWVEVDRLLKGLSWDQLETLTHDNLLTYRLLAWAARRDTSSLRHGLDRLRGPLGPFDRAQIAALLGDSAQAVELVAQGFREGFYRGFTLFVFPGLDGLSGYPPYDRLVGPTAAADHQRRVSRFAKR